MNFYRTLLVQETPGAIVFHLNMIVICFQSNYAPAIKSTFQASLTKWLIIKLIKLYLFTCISHVMCWDWWLSVTSSDRGEWAPRLRLDSRIFLNPNTHVETWTNRPFQSIWSLGRILFLYVKFSLSLRQHWRKNKNTTKSNYNSRVWFHEAPTKKSVPSGLNISAAAEIFKWIEKSTDLFPFELEWFFDTKTSYSTTISLSSFSFSETCS